jgi:hypothetical protein
VLVGRLLFDVILTIVFICAILAVFHSRRMIVIALLLGVPTLVSLWTGYVVPGLPQWHMSIGLHWWAALFLAFTVGAILSIIHTDATVTADSLYGAFCGYLLIGLLFGHLYCSIESLEPGSFEGARDLGARLRDQDQRHFVLSYFSFMTLSTVGYGDITPIHSGARALAVVEAMVGQFYIAILIAELIGKRVAHALSQPK